MFKRRHNHKAKSITVYLEGEKLAAREGESVAAALLAHGTGDFRRSVISGGPRAPYCMIGVCFECLVEIDGVANRQACLAPVREGMRISRQYGMREVAPEIVP